MDKKDLERWASRVRPGSPSSEDDHYRSEAPGVQAVLNTLSPEDRQAFDTQHPYAAYAAEHRNLKAEALASTTKLQHLHEQSKNPRHATDRRLINRWQQWVGEELSYVEHDLVKLNSERLVNVHAFVENLKPRSGIAAQVSPTYETRTLNSDVNRPASPEATSPKPAQSPRR